MTFQVLRRKIFFRNLLVLHLATFGICDNSNGLFKLDYSVIQATGKFCPNRDTCQTTGRQNRGPEGIENDWKKRNCFCDNQVTTCISLCFTLQKLEGLKLRNGLKQTSTEGSVDRSCSEKVNFQHKNTVRYLVACKQSDWPRISSVEGDEQPVANLINILHS